MEAVLKNYVTIENKEESFEQLLSVVAVENEVTDQAKLREVNFLLAYNLWEFGLQDQALDYIQRCIDQVQNDPDPMLNYFYSGTKVGYLLKMGRAEEALRLAQELGQLSIGLDSLFVVSGLNNIGLSYLKLHDREMARTFFDSCLAMMPTGWDEHMQLQYLNIAIKDNIAEVEALGGNLDTAIEIVSNNIIGLMEIDQKDEVWFPKLVEYGLRRAELEMKSEDWHAALRTLENLRDFFAQCPEGLTIEDELMILKDELKVASHNEEVDKERRLADSVLTITDRINHQLSERQLSSIQRLSAISLNKTKEEYIRSLQLSEQKVRLRNFVLLFMGVLSTLLLGTGYLVYKVRLQHRQMENQRLEIELSHKNRDLGNLALGISRRKEAAEEVLNYLSELKANKKNRVEAIDISALEKDLKKKIKADEKREWVHSQVEDINSAFYERLQMKYPLLVPTELELCAMIRSRMSNKQIAEIRNISPSSARKARYRLGRKLGIGDGEDMVELLNRI